MQIGLNNSRISVCLYRNFGYNVVEIILIAQDLTYYGLDLYKQRELTQLITKLSEIDFVIFATSSPDYYVPGSGSVFQNKMGLDNIGVLDIRQGCSGFTYALTVANQFIKSGTHENIWKI